MDNGLKVLVFWVGAIKLELGLQWNTVGQTTLNALCNAVSRWVDEIVKEFQHELVSRVRDREILIEHLKKALCIAVLRLGFKLEELAEGPELDVEKIRIGEIRCGGGERVSLLQLWRQHIVRLIGGVQIAGVQVGFGGAPCSIQGTRRSDRDLRPA